MLQMVGVIILSLGLPAMYASMAEGGHIDNQVMVAGYVVMRIALVAQWLRAARQDPQRRSACLTYATVVTVAQIGWIAMIPVSTSVAATFLWAGILVVFEMSGPFLAERRMGGTPWHAHHIAERYSLLAIIALGEGVVGTVASLSAIVSAQGWSVAAVLVVVAGTGLTFAMWWVYFSVPQAEMLHARRDLSFRFGYLHIILFGSIVATGAGLHAAAYYVEHHSHLSAAATVSAVAVPVAVYIATVYLLHMSLRTRDAAHVSLVAAAMAVLVVGVLLAGRGMSMANALLIVMLAPAVVVVGYELLGHLHARDRATRV
jgi:low temperature requirement protein LtrA